MERVPLTLPIFVVALGVAQAQVQQESVSPAIKTGSAVTREYPQVTVKPGDAYVLVDPPAVAELPKEVLPPAASSSMHRIRGAPRPPVGARGACGTSVRPGARATGLLRSALPKDPDSSRTGFGKETR